VTVKKTLSLQSKNLPWENTRHPTRGPTWSRHVGPTRVPTWSGRVTG